MRLTEAAAPGPDVEEFVNEPAETPAPSATSSDWVDSLAQAVLAIFKSTMKTEEKKKKILELLKVIQDPTLASEVEEALLYTGRTPLGVQKAITETLYRRQFRKPLSVGSLLKAISL